MNKPVCVRKYFPYYFTLFLLFLLSVPFLLSGCGKNGLSSVFPGGIKKYTSSDIAMGTVISASIYGTDSEVSDRVMTLLETLEKDYLSWREDTSEVARINASAGSSGGYALSEELLSWMTLILTISEESGGALDPTLGQLTALWDIEGEHPKVPEKEEISALLSHCGYRKVLLKDSLIFLPEGMSLDLGAVGKGIACDEIQKMLREDDTVTSAVISVGGSVLTFGTKPDGSDWTVAVTDPRSENGYLGVIQISDDCFISTSGDYEKYFIEDGVRYHHILDPATGYPADSGLISVTILSDSGAVSDALSTACFVLGFEDSLALLEAYGAEGIFVDESYRVWITQGMMDRFTLSNDSYTISNGGHNEIKSGT